MTDSGRTWHACRCWQWSEADNRALIHRDMSRGVEQSDTADDTDDIPRLYMYEQQAHSKPQRTNVTYRFYIQFFTTAIELKQLVLMSLTTNNITVEVECRLT